MKSFYVVELASTGGFYRDSQLAYGTLTEMQQALDFELVTDVRAQAYIFAYDALPLRTYIQGRRKQEINLFPFLTIRGPSGVTFTLHEEGLWRSLTRTKDGLVLAGSGVPADDAFWASVLLWIDWGAVPLMPLEEPLLEPGEPAEYEWEYQGRPGRGTFPYGYSNTEDEDDNEDTFRARMDEAFAIDPSWLSNNGGAVRALAESMHRTGDYSTMPILADALQEAGCDDELLLWHCRAPAGAHARGSWLVEQLRRF
jgi:hypothetical protein